MHVQIDEQPAERHEEIRAGLGRRARRRAGRGRRLERHARARGGGSRPRSPRRRRRCRPRRCRRALAFLRWMEDEPLHLPGLPRIPLRGRRAKARPPTIVEGSGLGLLRDEDFMVFDGLRNLGSPAGRGAGLRPPGEAADDHQGEPPVDRPPARADRRHRRQAFDEEGKVIGEHAVRRPVHLGRLSLSPRAIPLLRSKVERIFERAGFAPDSHDGKALLHILETFPRDELFQIGEDELFEIAHRHPAPAGAPAHRAVRAPRPLRALRLLPRLRAARPLRHRAAPARCRRSSNGPSAAG